MASYKITTKFGNGNEDSWSNCGGQLEVLEILKNRIIAMESLVNRPPERRVVSVTVEISP